MYPHTVPTIRGSRSFMALILGILVLWTMEISIAGQVSPVQLTLADIIVALRSQKVTLAERNKILTDAVLVRGITFALTPEIEKELTVTGADKDLVKAIKSKSPTVKVSAVVPSGDAAKSEFLTHQQQADASFARGDVDAAVVEYSKAIELQPALSPAYFSRGRIYLTKGWYDKAIADFSKAIELEPKDAAAFSNRGQAWEKKGDAPKAIADFTKAVDLKKDDATAKNALDRLTAELARTQPAPNDQNSQPPAAKSVLEQSPTTGTDPNSGSAQGKNEGAMSNTTTPVSTPDVVNVGNLSPSDALRLVKPVYSSLALKSNIAGKVSVTVMIDEEGNVTSARAVDGHILLRQSSEDAARRSKFKPALYQGKPIRSTGVITYNYTPSRSAELGY